MFILIVLIATVVVGYVASLKRKRFSIWIYIFTAFLGALAGAFISFGDSVLFLNSPFLNIWTVPVILSILFSLVAIFADHGKIAQTIISIFIIIGAISGAVYLDSSPSNKSGLFREAIILTGVERIGQPIEGFDAYLLQQAFSGLLDEDFDGVQSLEGIYSYNGQDLVYTRTKGQPITSAEQTISDIGMNTLYNNLIARLPNVESIEQLIKIISGRENIYEQAFEKNGEEWIRYTEEEIGLYFEYRKNPSGYVVTNPNNHEAVKSFTLHSADEFYNQRKNSEGGPAINIEVFNPGPNVTPNDWIISYDQSNYVKGSPFKETRIGNNTGTRYEWEGLYKGETAVVAWKGWIYTISVMYIDKDSQIYQDFEEMVSSLKILFMSS